MSDWILDGATDMVSIDEIPDDELDVHGNRLQAVVVCPRCSQEVELWASPEEGEAGGFDPVAHGECCGLVFVDWWEGTVFFEEAPQRPIVTVVDPQGRL